MSTTAPPPNSTPTAVPPTSPSSPPPPVSPLPPVSPTTQPNATPPDSSPPPPVQTPPPQSPPPAVPATPPPSIVSPPPPTVASPPPTTSSPPPVVSSPPPTNSEPPPPPSDPPKSSPSPPPPSDPPKSSPSPPPPSDPPKSSPSPPPPSDLPPPPTSTPPVSSPPPPTPIPPKSSPPPSTPKPPESSPPPPSIDPPTSSPPPPKATPPTSSPPPPKTQPPTNSPPPPQESKPPVSSPPPPTATPPKISPPSPTSPPPSKLSPPSPPIKGQPPTSDLTPPSSPSPPTPSQASVPPSGLASPANAQISTAAVAGISAVLGLIVLGLAGLLVWCIVKRKRKASGYNAGYIMPSPYASSLNSGSSFLKGHSSAPLVGSASGSDSIPSPGLGNSRPWFTYEELFVATNGFSEQNLLGEGGFGCVYKGCLPDGRVVAVKQLKIGGGQGEREFKAEVEIISRIHHRHLVSLVGYCISDSRRLLIYEFVPNDTLYFHLHGKDRPVMDWAMRVKVAAGAARGIAYLHEDCHPRIIHRDIKSSNILLGANFEARVSDFGLAKLAADADTHITTRIMGTFGYMAPEYASSGKLTDKSDVYSFGVVLLEMITGRKPVDASQPLGDESLVEWARPLLSDALETQQFDRIVDPRLEKNYVESEMFLMVEAAAACVRHSSAKRPRMSQVVRALDSVTASDLSNGMKPGESEVYDSAEQSAEIRLFQRMAFGSQNYSTDFFSQSSMMNNKATISEKFEPHESADRS